jgi:hypothetical protein
MPCLRASSNDCQHSLSGGPRPAKPGRRAMSRASPLQGGRGQPGPSAVSEPAAFATHLRCQALGRPHLRHRCAVEGQRELELYRGVTWPQAGPAGDGLYALYFQEQQLDGKILEATGSGV